MKRSGLFLLFVILFFPLISAGNYGARTYGKGLYGIGEVIPTTPSTTPPSGGGGGGPSCTYDWDCTNWSPLECPVEEIQERICVNRGTCKGTVGMPNQTRTCKYEHKEPLFDIFLTIPPKYEKMCAGKKINANIKLENYGKIELLDAFMTYWIIDKNNSLISEVKDTRSITDKMDFDMLIKVPESISSGTYRLYAQITYSGNKTATAGESFEVMEEDYCKPLFNLMGYLPFILTGFVFFIMFILIIILFRKFRHIEKRKKKEIFIKKPSLIKKRIIKDKSAENLRALIHSAKKSRKEFSDYLRKITRAYLTGRISYPDYSRILSQERNGKNIREWIEYLKRYEKECKKRLKTRKKIRKRAKV